MKIDSILKNRKIQKSLAVLIIAGLSAVAGFFKKTVHESIKVDAREIIYTRHAECRMKCRNIDESEVTATLQQGQVNSRKSEPERQPCPVVAKELKTIDQQKIRVVYGDCAQAIKIITVIDLESESENCYCR